MDPDANLAEMRRLTLKVLNGTEQAGDAERIAELFEALDEWLSRGGALPQDWQKHR